MSSSASASILLKGTHGTSKSRAETILREERFQASDDGLLGAGAYFWAYDNDISLAKRLAHNWWRFACGKYDAYKGDTDPSPAVLAADIQVDPSVYFDANSESFLELLVKTAERKEIESTKDDFNKLRVVLLKEIETVKGISYKVVKAELDVPGRISGETGAPYVYWAAKQAASYVVMPNALDIIRNIKLVEV
jgi:hypothetical protein